MKKIIAVLIGIVMVLSLIPITVSAADSANFKITVVSQDNNSATVTFDFAEGTGFSAIDFAIKYETKRLTLTKCSLGEGYKAFRTELEDKGIPVVYSINQEGNPIKGSMANTEAFRATSGSGSLIQMTFTKSFVGNLKQSDIKVSISNCQTSEFKDITPTVSYSLSGNNAGSENNPTEYTQGVSVNGDSGENASEGYSDSEIGEEVIPSDSSEANNNDNSSSVSSSAESADNNQTQESSSKTKTAVIIISAVVFLAAVGILTTIIVKKSKQNIED